MEVFRDNGHLTREGLNALAAGEPLDELTRLEIAEHLAYCDLCLQRYTEVLETAPLAAPERSCRESLWRKLRARTLRLLTSRYATAAAAVALALTVLWGSGQPGLQPVWEKAESAMAETAETWPERWNSALEALSGGLHGLFDRIGALRETMEGGKTP